MKGGKFLFDLSGIQCPGPVAHRYKIQARSKLASSDILFVVGLLFNHPEGKEEVEFEMGIFRNIPEDTRHFKGGVFRLRDNCFSQGVLVAEIFFRHFVGNDDRVDRPISAVRGFPSIKGNENIVRKEGVDDIGIRSSLKVVVWSAVGIRHHRIAQEESP
jgi:hypothetical protein